MPGHHRHALALRHQRRRQRVHAVGRPRGPRPRRGRLARTCRFTAPSAGGVTTARLLHGSANVIGGQDAVIKLKYGTPGEGAARDRRPAGREVRPRRERQADRRPVPEHAGWASRPCSSGRSPRPGPTARQWDDYEPSKDRRAAARAAPRPAAGGAGRHPRGRSASPLPLLPGGRDPDAAARRRPVRRQGAVAAARPRRLQGRRRDRGPRGERAACSPTGGRTRSRRSTRSRSPPPCCTRPAPASASSPTATS